MSKLPTRTMPWSRSATSGPEPLITREWIVTNGLGGYASGTVAGVATRRYHGLLIAAHPAPLGRVMMLDRLSERVSLPDGTLARLGGHERKGRLRVSAASTLSEFRLEAGLPVWRFEVGSVVLEKRICLPHLQNTVHITYSIVSGGGTVSLRLRPALDIRGHDDSVGRTKPSGYSLCMKDDHYEVNPSDTNYPTLRFRFHGGRPVLVAWPGLVHDLHYRIEAARGYPNTGVLWSPGHIRVILRPDRPVTLTASTESWATIDCIDPEEAYRDEIIRRQRLLDRADPRVREAPASEMVLAADQFVIQPAGRIEDNARAHAVGDEVRTVIAGYHWFTDWGRDTMISLEGLTLTTGRHNEAGWILRAFAYHIKDGLIPNMFPEGQNGGLYHTADATLWFFHALDRYLETTHDRTTLQLLLPKLIDVARKHIEGTRFGIGVDPKDGLLTQGAQGYQLTWMDAKVDGWVVTPRRGKAVEINGLWYNALRLLARWLESEGRDGEAAEFEKRASQAYESFNRRFWNESTGYLYDVVDGEHGDDDACRPNQLLAISPRYPVLDRSRWEPVIRVVEEHLLTPVGLRSLAPGQPDYKPTYHGDLRSRDAAYHQGTVWSWFVGPFADAWLKAYPDDLAGARKAVIGLVSHFGEACVGSISEIFDAEDPYTPRGCIAQAWGVAEFLRIWAKTGLKPAEVESTDDLRVKV